MITPVLISKYLSQQCTPDEVRMIEAWIGENAENKGIFSRLEKMWNETGQARPAREVQDTAAAWQKVKARMQQPAKQPARRSLTYILTRAAAAAVIIFGLITFYLINNSSGGIKSGTAMKMVEISTKKGERRELALADGTTVWLNAETSIKYPENFDGDTREVYLDGEAYFKVTKNADKPFMVHTDEMVTKVLGTQFNVLAYHEMDSIIVALDEGKVALSYRENKIELEPGYQASFGKQQHNFDKTEINGQHNQWKNNVVDFDNVTLGDAVVTLQRWFNTKIVLTEPSIKNCRITATFTNPTPDEVMEIIQSVLPVEVEKREGVYYINGKNCD